MANWLRSLPFGRWTPPASATTRSPVSAGEATEVATLGAGCFWCLDAVARMTDGVVSSVCGYAGGSGAAPTYWDLHGSGDSSWVEAVQIEFVPRIIDFAGVLDLFFRTHDPTRPNQDGANRGPEYHSTIFFHSTDQRDVAESLIPTYAERIGRPIVTTVRPFTTFSPAELEHQDFYNANPTHPYCTFVIIPKLRKVIGEA